MRATALWIFAGSLVLVGSGGLAVAAAAPPIAITTTDYLAPILLDALSPAVLCIGVAAALAALALRVWRAR